MTRKRLTAGIVIVVIGAGLYLAAPIYSFYAHRGGLPLPPGGWQSLPDEAPARMAHAQEVSAQTAARALEALSTHRDAIGAPAITAAVGRGGQVIWAGAVGYADVADAREVTLDTAFRIGSTSKAVTATLFARLVDRQAVSIDQRLGTVFETLPNAAWSEITLRQLASHSAGLPHYKENTELGGLYRSMTLDRHYPTMRDAVALFDDSELLSPPGESFHYSTLGTVLLGAALAEAAGSSYLELLEREVTTPLGLGTLQAAPRQASAGSGVATSYVVRDGRVRRWRAVDLSHRLPGGGLAASSRDLVRLGLAWLDEDYIRAQTRSAFWTPQRLNSGDVNPQNYALGFRWTERAFDDGHAIEFVHHGGVSRGAQSALLIFPELDLVIAFNTNRNTEDFSTFSALYEVLLSLFA